MAVVVIIDGKRQGKEKGNKKKERAIPLLWVDKGEGHKPKPRAPKEVHAGGKPSSSVARRSQRAFKRLPANRRQEPKGALG